MNKDILLVVDMVSNEKGVNKSIIFNALECALASATKKQYGSQIDVRVTIDIHTGDYVAFRRWQVVDTTQSPIDAPTRQIELEEAQKQNPNIQVSEYVEEVIDSVSFDRIGAQTAKQVIVQKIREAERAQIVEAYQSRQGELVSGVVKRIERGNIILDLGNNVEAIILREEMIPRETVRNGDRLRGYLQSVRPEQKGPQIFLSRTDTQLLVVLFTLEVPEIGEHLIEVLGAARDPGLRAKIAVRTKDSRVDPIGACVGMRGSRVQAVTNELAGERIDIILWDENPVQFVINAMLPVEVASIIVDEDAHSMDVAVREEQLSQAIGRGGQNVRLASQLTGWNLNVMTQTQATEKNNAEQLALQNLFMSQLDIDEEIAGILIREGFSSIEEIAYVPVNEIVEIKEFDENMVKELRIRAKDSLLIREIAKEEADNETTATPTQDLLDVEGMNNELATLLATQGVINKEDLAEQSVDELMMIANIDEAQAASLIMAARADWFANEER
jgi:N utilization substance protein A